MPMGSRYRSVLKNSSARFERELDPKMKKKPIIEYAMPHVRELHAYTPGFQPKESGWIKLNTNESPYSPSPAVEAAVKEAAAATMRLYPDPRSTAVREEVAKLHGLDASNVIVGNGSDDILNLLTRAFSDFDRKAGWTFPSYSLYPVLSGIQNAATVEIPFDRLMELPLEALLRSRAQILFFTSPNAPTGVGFSKESIRALLEGFEGILVVDEAYADFAEENVIELLAAYPQLVVTRTFSKAYAMAGVRLGYALGDPEVIDILDRVRDSYNVNRFSQAAGLAALRDQSYLKAIVGKVKRTRDYYRSELDGFGWFTYRSVSNFLFTEPRDAEGRVGPEVAVRLFEFLKENKILVRYFPGHALTESFLRISVGDEDQMLALSETIKKWLKNA